jgi:DNA primase
MIPIHNERGQIIAFGGRSLNNDNQPKYLNSPETPVFFKGKNLYALYQAKEAIKEEDGVILMEGYFDAISAHACGISNVVATLGTALTSDQLRILGKYTHSKRIYFAFDADLAGGTATNRGIEVIKETFGGLGGIKILDSSFSKNSVYEIHIISIPEGKDPDDYIRNKGKEAFNRLVKNAPFITGLSDRTDSQET